MFINNANAQMNEHIEYYILRIHHSLWQPQQLYRRKQYTLEQYAIEKFRIVRSATRLKAMWCIYVCVCLSFKL